MSKWKLVGAEIQNDSGEVICLLVDASVGPMIARSPEMYKELKGRCGYCKVTFGQPVCKSQCGIYNPLIEIEGMSVLRDVWGKKKVLGF